MNDEEKPAPEYKPTLSLLNESIFNSLDLAHLSESEIKLLMEGRKDNAIKKYGDTFHTAAMETLVNYDEQNNYKYLAWMANDLAKYIALTGDDREYEHVEKAEEIIAIISDFMRYSKRLKKKDINQYSSSDEILAAIEADVILPDIEKERKKRDTNPQHINLLRTGQSEIIYENDRYFVVRPESQEASCFFGAKTKWCIAQTGNSYFQQYSADGKIFYYIKDDAKKNDDRGYKLAIEISSNGGEVYYNNVWDRFDDQHEIDSGYPSDLMDTLTDTFEMPHDSAEGIVDAVHTHAQDNLPSNPLEELSNVIDSGKYNSGYVTVDSDYEEGYDGDGGYMNVNASVYIDYTITNEQIVEMLENDEIDIDRATEAIIQALQVDESLYSALEDDVDIGASKYWWPDVDQWDEAITAEIRGGTGSWAIIIQLRGFVDPDQGGSYHSADDAESFCDMMQEEWGERNTAEIEEVFDHHIYRYFAEYSAKHATAFQDLRSEFTSGRHELTDQLWYDVDDEENENSDLNLYIRFNFDLTEDALDSFFMGKDLVNTTGNTVRVAQANSVEAASRLRRAISAGGGTENFLEKAIYSVYTAAVQESEKQLKLDFGPDFDGWDQMTFPKHPQALKGSVQFDRATKDKVSKSDNMVPRSGQLQMDFAIYIPFHQSEAELSAITNFFNFIQKSYDEVASYIHKYIGHGGGVGMSSTPGQPRSTASILKEDLLFGILSSQALLKSLKEESYSKKKSRYSKS